MPNRLFAMVSMACSHQFTLHALQSFFATSEFRSTDRFIIIDNDKYLESRMLSAFRVEILTNSTPIGFAANVNQALELALDTKSDLYFLNNDLIFSKQWLEPLLSEEPVILSPMTNREVQYSTEKPPTSDQEATLKLVLRPTMELGEYIGCEEIFESMAQYHREAMNGYLDVMALPFCCVKIPHLVYSEVGRFDEDFGLGGAEDYDYSLRALLAGFSTKYALQSLVLHFGGKSSWSSGEEIEKTKSRESKFRKVFEEKWGSKVCDLALNEFSEVLNRPDFQKLIEKRDLRTLLLELMQGKTVTVNIPF